MRTTRRLLFVALLCAVLGVGTTPASAQDVPDDTTDGTEVTVTIESSGDVDETGDVDEMDDADEADETDDDGGTGDDVDADTAVDIGMIDVTNDIGRLAVQNRNDIEDLERIAWSATALAFVAILIAIATFVTGRRDGDEGDDG